MPRSNIVTGLDIGTTKVCAVIGEIGQGGDVDVIGVGVSPSLGLRKGVIVDLDSTVKAISEAVARAEHMAGVNVRSAYVGIAGAHISSVNSRGVVAVSGQNREISDTDVERVIDAAKVISIPPDREIVHVIPCEYVIDGCRGIKDPTGMAGIRLEVETHIITGAATSIQNVVRSVERAGLSIEDKVLQPLASGEAVLTAAERELGVMLLDIGGGTTDIAVFCEGTVRHTAVIPIGGNHVTNDIAVGLRTPVPEAEEIKKEFGCAMAEPVPGDETIDIITASAKRTERIPRRLLCSIIEPRLREILEMVNRDIRASGYHGSIPAGVVLTGGTSLIENIGELAMETLDLPVRVGVPQGITGLVDVVSSPSFATGVGLARLGAKEIAAGLDERGGGSLFGELLSGIRDWFRDLF